MPNIYKFNIGNEFVIKTATAIITFIKEQEGEPVRIALSGGSSPKAVYEKLAQSDIDWSKVELYQVDERADHSNAEMIEASLTSKLKNLKAFHQFDSKYEAKLKKLTRPFFDLVLLGLGSDGHTASIFPHTKAIEELEALVLETESPRGIKERLTLSFPAILSTQKIMFLVRGAEKRAVLEKMLNEDSDEMDLPAKVALQHDNVDIYFDYST